MNGDHVLKLMTGWNIYFLLKSCAGGSEEMAAEVRDNQCSVHCSVRIGDWCLQKMAHKEGKPGIYL